MAKKVAKTTKKNATAVPKKRTPKGQTLYDDLARKHGEHSLVARWALDDF